MKTARFSRAFFPMKNGLEKNILLAKHSVDLLNMLEDKFKNGLNADEQKLLQDILYEVKIKYIQQA